MRQEAILRSIFDPASRADPYPLFAELRRTPVSWQEDGPDEAGTYVVSTYREIAALLHDPRVSSEARRCTQTGGAPRTALEKYSFIRLDPPEHDRLRALAMRHFGPPERAGFVERLRPDVERVATELVDALQGERAFDVVARVAYPLPVAVICTVLGVPRDDQPQFRVWADALVESVAAHGEAARVRRERASTALAGYMASLVERRRRQPGDDLLSRMAAGDGDGRMEDPFLVATAVLLLVAGHETTVNLIANGVLTLLRHPGVLDRLRREPRLVVGTVEELLRYEPPVQLLSNRTTLDTLDVAGVTIPKGVLVSLALAAGNRDPLRFQDPDRFDPERRDNAHLGFGSGIHYCFGAPLARIEAQIALTAIVQRLEGPRLVSDPPPYRPSPVLRGPSELRVEVDAVRGGDWPPCPRIRTAVLDPGQ